MAATVSAVIPVYNGEEFLGDAIRSVLEQTFAGIECIVIDDGSTDGSASIARSFGSDVHLVRRANGGVAAARNSGIAIARGRWISFLDADDVWLHEKIERQLDDATAAPDAVLLYTGMHVVDRSLRLLHDVEAPDPRVALRNSLLLEQPSMAIPSTAIVPASVLAAVGGFDERLSTSADTDLACRLCLEGPIRALSEPLALYRVHERQMHANLDAMEHDMLLVFDKVFASPKLPADLKGLHRRARANLFATIAAQEMQNREFGAGAVHALRSMASDPARAAALVGRRLNRLSRSISRRDRTVRR